MDKVKVGVVVNTHGIRGELRIMSGSRYSNNEFVKTDKVWIGKDEFKVASHRVHKSFDMIKLEGFNNINDVEHLKGRDLFVLAENVDVESNFESMIGKNVIQDGEVYSKVVKLAETKAYKILILENEVMVPNTPNFVIEIGDDIIVQNVKGFLDTI